MNSKKKAFGIALIVLSLLIMLMIPLIPVKMNRIADLSALNRINENIAIVYFGFPNCSEVCPTTLATLNEIYNDYLPQSSKEPLAVLFVNLIAGATVESSKVYVDQFNNNFTVLSLSKKEMSKAKIVFGLTFSDVQEDGQLFHKGYTYLLKRTNDAWRIKYVYVQGTPERDQVYKDILTLTNLSSG